MTVAKPEKLRLHVNFVNQTKIGDIEIPLLKSQWQTYTKVTSPSHSNRAY